MPLSSAGNRPIHKLDKINEWFLFINCHPIHLDTNKKHVAKSGSLFSQTKDSYSCIKYFKWPQVSPWESIFLLHTLKQGSTFIRISPRTKYSITFPQRGSAERLLSQESDKVSSSVVEFLSSEGQSLDLIPRIEREREGGGEEWEGERKDSLLRC